MIGGLADLAGADNPGFVVAPGLAQFWGEYDVPQN
jgi:hypothetical protein